MYEIPDVDLDGLSCVYVYSIFSCDIRGKIGGGGLIYVGQTSTDAKGKLKKRHYAHMHGDQMVDKYLRTHKYKLEILWIGFREDADATERYFINFFNCRYPFGLNFEEGGINNKSHSEETRKLISEKAKIYMKKRWTDPEYHEHMREIARGENNPFYRKKHTPETKKKLSEIRKGKSPGKKSKEGIENIKRHKSKQIYCIDEDGNRQDFNSINEAAEKIGVLNTSISRALHSKNNKLKKRYWYFAKEYKTYI